MSLILTGNSSNITIDSTNGITFPNSSNQVSAGVILQVVSATFSNAFSTTSTTLQLSNVSLSITPKFATSKILVMAACAIYIGENGQGQVYYYGRCSLARGSTQLIEGRMNINTGSTAITDGGVTLPITYLDSPATASSVTYNIYISALNNPFSMQINANAPSTLTLMEVAG